MTTVMRFEEAFPMHESSDGLNRAFKRLAQIVNGKCDGLFGSDANPLPVKRDRQALQAWLFCVMSSNSYADASSGSNGKLWAVADKLLDACDSSLGKLTKNGHVVDILCYVNLENWYISSTGQLKLRMTPISSRLIQV